MDPLPYKTWPNNWHSDSTCLGQPRYTMIGQDHDSVPNRHLRALGVGPALARPLGRGLPSPDLWVGGSVSPDPFL